MYPKNRLQIEGFQGVWKAHAPAYVGRLRERSLGGPLVATSIKWQLQLGLGSSVPADSEPALSQPSALFEFTLHDAASVPPASTGASAGSPSGAGSGVGAGADGDADAVDAAPADRFAVECSKDQLFDLLRKLDRVQEQLDSLSAK